MIRTTLRILCPYLVIIPLISRAYVARLAARQATVTNTAASLPVTARATVATVEMVRHRAIRLITQFLRLRCTRWASTTSPSFSRSRRYSRSSSTIVQWASVTRSASRCRSRGRFRSAHRTHPATSSSEHSMGKNQQKEATVLKIAASMLKNMQNLTKTVNSHFSIIISYEKCHLR